MKSIRFLLFLVLASLVTGSCGASYKQYLAGLTPEEEAQRQANVKALRNCDFILDVTQIVPRGFPSKVSMGEYDLRLKGDVVTTRLPYIGRSFEAAYGDDEISVVFDNEKVDLKTDFKDASTKGAYRYSFKGGVSRIRWTVNIEVFDSGMATIDCMSDGGRSMTYYANLVIPDKKDEQ